MTHNTDSLVVFTFSYIPVCAHAHHNACSGQSVRENYGTGVIKYFN